jgi:hypothetical protein
MDVRPCVREKLKRPPEQRRGGVVVPAPEGATPGGREPASGALGQPRLGLSELGPVAGSLLQVVADDLVPLDEVGSARLDPAREALVQLGPKPGLQLQAGDTLSEGDSGPRVRRLQRALAELGYDVTADGEFGPGTSAAVQSFQEEAGLQADGVVGSATVQAINEALAERG